ncbi:MAG: NAD(P)H-dependent oxidoreductase [Clostridia bacterium]|nr:NAD(P)H-dependent oxidoreductase [Clostridia bacterium]
MKLIKVILGSTRDGRRGIKVARWVMKNAAEYKGGLQFELVDLKEINLPCMNEPVPPKESRGYKYEHTKNWSRIISGADGFIIVTPEYNHGYPGVLKNALDYLYKEWVGKPMGLVGYGNRGAAASIIQLRKVLLSLDVRILDYQVGISEIWEAFDQNDQPKKDKITGSLAELFTALEKAM